MIAFRLQQQLAQAVVGSWFKGGNGQDAYLGSVWQTWGGTVNTLDPVFPSGPISLTFSTVVELGSSFVRFHAEQPVGGTWGTLAWVAVHQTDSQSYSSFTSYATSVNLGLGDARATVILDFYNNLKANNDFFLFGSWAYGEPYAGTYLVREMCRPDNDPSRLSGISGITWVDFNEITSTVWGSRVFGTVPGYGSIATMVFRGTNSTGKVINPSVIWVYGSIAGVLGPGRLMGRLRQNFINPYSGWIGMVPNDIGEATLFMEF